MRRQGGHGTGRKDGGKEGGKEGQKVMEGVELEGRGWLDISFHGNMDGCRQEVGGIDGFGRECRR